FHRLKVNNHSSVYPETLLSSPNQVDSLLGNPQLPKTKLIHGN
ncbi:unnamed protein product, partial [Brassica oleracea]